MARRPTLHLAGLPPTLRLASMVGLAIVGLATSAATDAVSRASAAPTEAEGGPGALRIGETAPPMRAERIVGSDEVSLPRLGGRVVVLDFWATWCRPCRAIMPVLDQLNRRLHDRGLTVIGVSRERRPTIEAHLQRAPVTYTVARDVGGTQLQYGISALPTLVIIDRRGRVREVRVGGDHIETLGPLLERLLAEPAP